MRHSSRKNTTKVVVDGDEDDPRFSLPRLRELAERLQSELGDATRPAATAALGSIFDALMKFGYVADHPDAHKNFRRSAAALLGHARRRKRRREAKEARRNAEDALAAMVDLPPPPHRRPGSLPIGQRRFDRIIRFMEPGLYYARGDLARGAGFGLNARGELVRTLLANALVTRVPYSEAGKGSPNNPEPLWLYRLTSKGEALREQLCQTRAERMLGGNPHYDVEPSNPQDDLATTRNV
jgi:hypothetical protein